MDDLAKLLIAIPLYGLFSIGFGTWLALKGMRHIREDRFPITSTIHVSGFVAQLGGVTFMAFGLVCFISGIAAFVFGVWRIVELLGG